MIPEIKIISIDTKENPRTFQKEQAVTKVILCVANFCSKRGEELWTNDEALYIKVVVTMYVFAW